MDLVVNRNFWLMSLGYSPVTSILYFPIILK